MADLEFVSGGTRVRVEGLRAVQRRLNQAGADAQDQKDLMHRIGLMVIDGVNAPARTGRLAASMRAGRGKSKAVVRAGGARVPYAGVIHYGHPARNIAAQPFLTNSLRANQAQIFNALEQGMNDLLKKANLT
jgi:phage gpG-like protein